MALPFAIDASVPRYLPADEGELSAKLRPFAALSVLISKRSITLHVNKCEWPAERFLSIRPFAVFSSTSLSEGGPVAEIRPGDVVWFAPGE